MTPVNVSGTEAMNLRGGMERLSVVLTVVVGVVGFYAVAAGVVSRASGHYGLILQALAAGGAVWCCTLRQSPNTWLVRPVATALALLLPAISAWHAPVGGGPEYLSLGLSGLVLGAAASAVAAGAIRLVLGTARYVADGFRQTPTR